MIKFGTDGWRAVIAEDFTFENLRVVSQAIADYAKKNKKGGKRIVVGYDCRFLSREFAQTCCEVFAGNGMKTVLSDQAIPTPTVSFHCLHRKYDLGIMMTASHNPAHFNGLKIKTRDGGAADNTVTSAVEKLLGQRKPKTLSLDKAKKKALFRTADLTRDYVSFLRGFVDVKKIRKLKARVLVDTMYGAGDTFVEKILGKTSLEINYLHNEYNPSFGGMHPEPVPVNLQALIKGVRKGGYDLGVALDGDADRIAIIDSKGNFISAQTLLPLLAVHMVKNRHASGGIGKTVVGSNLIDQVASMLNVACYETPVGFKYISNLFKEKVICIGGEEAGGIGVKGYVPERDGSASFLLLLEMLAVEKKSFQELLTLLYRQCGRWYYRRESIPVASVKKSLEQMKLPAEILGKEILRVNTLDGVKLITKNSWLMFRKSGTEPIVRVYAEAKTNKEVGQLLKLGKKMIYAL
ncbi:MAG: phosphoglucomutase/phosphomannomutase family protein [Candidatus Omnitrophica bacterium]|nr:phosphoglucomutase/phosphomannomutase family protein [Candidatus Omnitrophota bacterium]